MTTYQERIAEAMGSTAPESEAVHGLAKSLEISYTAVMKVINGKSSAFKAEHNARAAKYLRVDSDWLATGEGEKVTTRVWPFVVLTQEKALSLTKVNLSIVEKLALDLLAAQQNTLVSVTSDRQSETPRHPTRARTPTQRAASNGGKGDQSEGAAPRKSRRS